MKRMLMAVAVLCFAGCSDDDEVKTADTYQTCFDDQPDNDPAEDKILTCCLDYEIAGVRYACGASVAECVNYLTDNLDQIDAGQPEKMSACEAFIDMRPDPAE